jgi:hypothetical protein
MKIYRAITLVGSCVILTFSVSLIRMSGTRKCDVSAVKED